MHNGGQDFAQNDPLSTAAQSVLQQFLLPRPLTVAPFHSPRAFSGAVLWRIAAGDRPLCLRRWPPGHPDEQRLSTIHSVLRHAAAGCSVPLPVPLPTRAGNSYVSADGAFWELTDWLPGRASFRAAPAPARLHAAMRALAEFHRAVADFEAPRADVSPGIGERLSMLRRLLAGEADVLLRAAGSITGWPEFPQRATRVLTRVLAEGPALARQLAAASAPVPLPYSIRDIWHEHVLFEGQQVTGIIDFGSVRRESRAADVARLLGSLALNDPAAWQQGRDAYNAVFPLSAAESALVPLFDASGVLLGGVNWIRWVAIEQRRFDSRTAVIERLDELLERRLGPLPMWHIDLLRRP